MPSVTMKASSPRNATRKPLIRPSPPPTTRATRIATQTFAPWNKPVDRTAARPRTDPTLMSMPPEMTTNNSARVTMPMTDNCMTRLLRLAPVMNVSLRIEARISNPIRIYSGY